VNAPNPDTAKDTRRRDRTQLEQAIRAAGGDVVRGNAVRCPFHDDRHASGSLYADEHGVWRVKCHTCKTPPMDVFDVTQAHTGRAVGDQLRELRPGMVRKPARVFAAVEDVVASLNAYTQVERVHQYANPDTRAVELLIVRARDKDGGKTFQQFQPNPGGGFISGAPPKPWPLYNRTVLRGAKAVVVVEGEKCVEALRAAGIPATSSPCGAGKAAHADWSPLAGLTVYLWPDNDPAGADHMRDVAGELAKVRPMPRVYRLDPAGLELPPKGDAVEYLDRLPADDDKADAVWEMLEARAESTGPASEVGELIEDMISGKWRALEWKFKMLGRLSKALFPGTTTLVCGDPGSTKSFLLLECLAHWKGAGGSKSTGSMDDMAGGASYPRHAQTVLWVQRKDPAEEVEIVSGSENAMNKKEEVDRVVRIVKSRNGKGHGASIAFNFLTDSLTFEEVGLINGKAKPAAKTNAPTSTWRDVPPQGTVKAPAAPQGLDFDDDDTPP
jgi:hypothetical protein